MKRTILVSLLLGMLLSCTCAFAQNGKTIYNRYSDMEGVEAVYISPAMFKLLRNVPAMEVSTKGGESVNLGKIVQSLTGFYLLSTANEKVGGQLLGDVDKFVSKGQYEHLMEVKDSGETMNMYIVADGKDTIASIVMVTRSGSEASFLCMDGSMSREDIEALIEKINSN